MGHLTYAELECRADQLAAFLLEEGAGPESCIGLLLERSAEFVVAALAILKTGAAYLPLDASTPADRASFILADSGAILLVTHRQKARGLKPAGWRAIEIDGSDAPSIATQPTNPICVEPIPSSLAYVVYTSGSTGQPKGVEITHANLLNLIEWHQSAFGVTAADRASQVAGLGFDAAAWEIWPYLTAGASLHFADELTRRSPQALRDWLVAEKIPSALFPPCWPNNCCRRTGRPSGLAELLTGADALHRRPVAGLPFVVVNNYGPTECTVVATSGAVAADAETSGPPSIGRPITQCDRAADPRRELRPGSPGEAGELCLAGALVGRGYRNQPELTASRFVTYSPSRARRCVSIARAIVPGCCPAGDRVSGPSRRAAEDSRLSHRAGEIVACLDRYPGIEASRRGCAATADAGPVLVAYVVAARNAQARPPPTCASFSPRDCPIT